MRYIKKVLFLMSLSDMITSGGSYVYGGDLLREIAEELS